MQASYSGSRIPVLERIDDATRSSNTFWLMMPFFEVGVLRGGASAFGLEFVLLRGRVSAVPLQLDWEIWSAESKRDSNIELEILTCCFDPFELPSSDLLRLLYFARSLSACRWSLHSMTVSRSMISLRLEQLQQYI